MPELNSSEKQECRWSKGKGTQPDTEGCRFKSLLSAQTFPAYKLLYRKYLLLFNNPLTYLMTTPNLDAIGHWWVGALAWFNLELEYQKGCDNAVADVLSQVTTQLNPNTVGSILDWVALGAVHWAEVHYPTVVESDHHLEQEVCNATDHALVQMHVTD